VSVNIVITTKNTIYTLLEPDKGWHAVGGILEPDKRPLALSVSTGFYSWTVRGGPSITHDYSPVRAEGGGGGGQ
jgi:hypothetical protein